MAAPVAPPSEQEIWLPVGGGYNQAFDERVRPIAQTEIDNGEFVRAGAVSKRHGIETQSVSVQGGGLISTEGVCKTLFSTGPELCVVGKRSLFARNEATGSWHNRGAVSPFTVKKYPAIYELATAWHGDMAFSGGYRLHVASVLDTGPGGGAELVAMAQSDDGQVTLPRTRVVSGHRNHIRCLNAGTKIVVIHSNLTSPPLEIHGRTWSPSLPSTGPSAPTTLVTDLATVLPDLRHASLDACATQSDVFALAYVVQTTQAVKINVYATSFGAPLRTATIPGTDADYISVALDYHAGSDRLYVLTTRDGGGGAGDVVELWVFKESDMSSVSGPTVIHTEATDAFVCMKPGIKRGNYSGGTDRLAMTWAAIDYGNGQCKFQSRSIITDLTGLDTATCTAARVCPVSRPWWDSGRAYSVVADYDHEIAISALFEGFQAPSNVIVDLDAGSASSTPSHQVRAQWDISLAAHSETSFGVQAQVNAETSALLSIQVPTVSHYHDTMGVAVVAQNLVLVRNDEAPTAIGLANGAALIGGGFVCFYDGEQTRDLGFRTKPFLEKSGSPGAGSDTHNWVAHWEEVQRGWLHRSPVSPATTTTTSATPPNQGLNSVTYPLSLRDYAQTSLAIHRATNGAEFLRSNSPAERVQNALGVFDTEVYTDSKNTAVLGALVYTASEADTIAPEGARVVSLVGDRPWFTQMVTLERAQHGKRLSIGSFGERLIAPETNEAFTVLMNHAEEMISVADLDEKVLLLTSKALYLVVGDGPDETGVGAFSFAQRLSSVTGCKDPRSVASGTFGVMFQGENGIYLLRPNFQLDFLGDRVRDFTDTFPVVTSAVVDSLKNHVLFTLTNATGTDGIVLVYNYREDAWLRWILKDDNGNVVVPASACMHMGQYYVLTPASLLWRMSTTSYLDAGVTYVPTRIKKSWFQPMAQGAWARLRRLGALLERHAPHKLTIRVATDFEATPSQIEERSDEVLRSYPDPTREQFQVALTRPRGQAWSFEVEDGKDGCVDTGQGFTITGLTATVVPRRRQARVAEVQR